MDGRSSRTLQATYISAVRIIISLHAGACCPVELSPRRVAVRYGDPVSINCSTSDPLYKGMGWEAPLGGTGLKPVRHLAWSVDALTRWHISPACFLSPVPKSGRKQCSGNPDVVVYSECLSMGIPISIKNNPALFHTGMER